MENNIKVLGIMCKLTGTDDYSYSDCIECKTCSYSVACRSKFDKEALDKAYEAWIDGQKLIEEGQAAIDYARTIFLQQLDTNELVKYQFKHLIINKIYVAPGVSYPKAKLLKTFTKEQLEPCAEYKEASYQLRINDLLKEKKKTNE